MEQPKEYNNEQELIKWLIYDLNEQKKEISKEKNIDINEVENKDLVLNIGYKNPINVTLDKFIKVNFSFDIGKIINLLSIEKIEYLNLDYINLSTLIFEKYFDLSKFKFSIFIDFSCSNFKKTVNFSNTIFNSGVNFWHCKFDDITKFNNCIFSDVDFSDTNFYNYVYFDNSVFNCDLELFQTSFYEKTSFKCTIFNGDVNLLCSYFNNKVFFDHANFNKNIEFPDYYNHFKYFSFNGTIFYSQVIFHYLKLENNFELYNFNVNENTELIFNSIIFTDDKYSISLINNSQKNKICIKKLSILNTRINGKIILKNIDIKNINLKNTYIMDNLYYLDSNFYNILNSETARILKNEELKKSNYIKALEYQAEETRLHKEELKEQFKENKNLKTFGDILSIELSSLYSDNGQNWIKAFICTILFPSVFFTLSYNIYNIPIFIFVLISFLFIPLCDNTKITKYIFISMFTYLILFIPIQNYIFSILIDIDNKSFIKELLSYITPTNFNQIILDKTNESYIYKDNTIIRAISYFIGKIAFWYGSVQTVQAFRKFAKGA